MNGMAATPGAQTVGASATLHTTCLFAEQSSDRSRALEANRWHLAPRRASAEAIVKPSEYSTGFPAPMSMEIVADQPFSTKSFFCEGQQGWVGYCDVPPSEMRAVPAAGGTANDAGVSIWVIEQGHLALDHPVAGATRFGPGTVLLWDSLQPPQARWDDARFGYVQLSPAWHKQVLGPEASTEARAGRRVEHLGLAPFLAAQLNAFAAHAATLTAAELGEVVGAILHVAEALLKVVFAPLASDGASRNAERLQTVQRYIEHNLHRDDLSVADIARGTHMSRAQLYRLFATQDTSVHGTLRERRLQRSMGCLVQPESQRLSIGAIGHACGFSDPAAFSKLFRQRFNLAPRDVRAASASATLAVDRQQLVRGFEPVQRSDGSRCCSDARSAPALQRLHCCTQ